VALYYKRIIQQYNLARFDKTVTNCKDDSKTFSEKHRGRKQQRPCLAVQNFNKNLFAKFDILIFIEQ